VQDWIKKSNIDLGKTCLTVVFTSE